MRLSRQDASADVLYDLLGSPRGLNLPRPEIKFGP